MPTSAWFDYYNLLKSLPPLSWSVLNPPSRGILLKPKLYLVSPLLPPSLPQNFPCLSTRSEWKQRPRCSPRCHVTCLCQLKLLLPSLSPCSLCPSHSRKLQAHSCPRAFACVIPILPPTCRSIAHSLPLSPSTPCSAISPLQGLLLTIASPPPTLPTPTPALFCSF